MTTFGFHGGPGGNHNGLGDYFQALDVAGIPACAKSTDDFGQVAQLADMRIASGVPHVCIFRMTEGVDGNGLDVPPYHLPPALAAEQHWQRTMYRLPPEFTRYKDIVWLEVVNELDQDKADWIGYFCVEIANIARAQGYKVALPSWSAGTPRLDGWETPGMLAYLQMCADYPTQVSLSLHEYSLDVNDIKHMYPHLIGRFDDYAFEACARNGISFPTTFITEWGWTYNDIPDPTQAMADIEWCFGEYNMFPQVKAAAIWYLGAEYGGIANKAQRLIYPVRDFMLTHGSAAPPEPPPSNTGDRGDPRVQYERVYVLLPPDHDKTWAHAVVDGSWESNRYTLGGSADDAGVGDLDVRKILAVNPEGWGAGDDRSGLSGFYRTYYPGVMYTPVRVGTPAELRAYLAGDTPPPPASAFEFKYWPTEHKFITQPFGVNPENYLPFNLPAHEGIDFRAPGGSRIFAVASGTVADVHLQAVGHNYGIFVRVDHIDGYQTTYAHMQTVSVSVGQPIQAGDVLGLANNTGNSSGDHLHITLKRKGYHYPCSIDPDFQYWPYNIFDPTPYVRMDLPIPQPGGGATAIGLHARADGGDYPEADFHEFAAMKPGVIKVLSSHSGSSIQRLAAEHPNIPFIIRAFLHFGGRDISPQQFIQDTISDVERAVNSIDIDNREVWVEIHNEPNLVQEGWTTSWQDGADFGRWVLEVLDGVSGTGGFWGYRRHLPASVNYMYPGLSPGGDVAGVRANHWGFFDSGSPAVQSFDGVGVHAYWATGFPMDQAVSTVEWFAVKTSKPLWVTEASRNDRPESVTPAVYAAEYLTFRDRLEQWAQVRGVTYFIASASNSYFHPECWVVNGQSKGIGAIIGAR